jgi:hypothetical protein
VADIKSEPRPASNRNRWPASYWKAWPASSESAAGPPAPILSVPGASVDRLEPDQHWRDVDRKHREMRPANANSAILAPSRLDRRQNAQGTPALAAIPRTRRPTWPTVAAVWHVQASRAGNGSPCPLRNGLEFQDVSGRTKFYVSAALAARETARSYRRLKRKYPEPKHSDAPEREARAAYRRAICWVLRARAARPQV